MVPDTAVDTTGTNNVTIKSTLYEKSRVSMYLVEKADSTKYPSKIVFKNAK